jgi:hypothetical protein
MSRNTKGARDATIISLFLSCNHPNLLNLPNKTTSRFPRFCHASVRLSSHHRNTNAFYSTSSRYPFSFWTLYDFRYPSVETTHESQHFYLLLASNASSSPARLDQSRCTLHSKVSLYCFRLDFFCLVLPILHIFGCVCNLSIKNFPSSFFVGDNHR